MAEELLKDYNGNLSGRTLGIFSKTGDSRASIERRRGFTDAMEHTDASISWSAAAPFSEEGEALLDSQPAVDLVIALDDNSLTMAGEYAARIICTVRWCMGSGIPRKRFITLIQASWAAWWCPMSLM